MSTQFPLPFASFARWLAVAALAASGSLASAQQQEPAPAQADPPARVATVTALEGSVVFAPAGETEWADLPRNRPIVAGDRVWTDEGARAEVHFGSAVLHMDSRTFLEVLAIDDNVVQLAVNEGSVNARVREMRAGDEFEITTPQLALRANQPGDWRLDVDPQQGFTRVAAHGGVAVLFGASGNAQQIVAGQQLVFGGRDLALLANAPRVADDGFERWAADRNRSEDQSVTAQIIPRDVVGYQELDQYGTWAQDPTYGAVWYPQVAAADWAPYRYGHWDWIAPWGWTWVDDAAWGFAPFHYGRWIERGTRWAWVPGPLGRHPVYSPALVAFVGGSGAGLTVANGPGIGWYPLAPGEVWRPYFDASPNYVRNANRYLVSDSRYYNTGPHYFLRRPEAVTSVRIDDFNRGRPVHQRWARINPAELARVQPANPPVPLRELHREQARAQAPAQQPRWTSPAQGFQQAPGVVRPPVTPREAPVRTQPNWRGGEEGGYSRWRGDTQQRQLAQQQVQQQAWREQQAQRVEAVRQQQAAREVQRQQAWQAQRQEQRAVAVQQQQRAWQPRAAAQPQRREERREERAVQHQAQRDEHGHGRHYE